MNIILNTPQWKHECSTCIFIGRKGYDDVYVCDKGRLLEVVIRHSDEGTDYWSGSIIKKETV